MAVTQRPVIGMALAGFVGFLGLTPESAAGSGPIDLGDVAAGGDGSGNAPAASTGIDPRNGRFTTGYHDGPLFESDPEGDGRNPSPGGSRYVDSVFLISGESLPGGGVLQPITRSGVLFPFAAGDQGSAVSGTWNYILRDRNGGVSAPPVRVGGREGFASAVGIHSSAGITFDLDALRVRHGVASVGCVSAFWGLDDCAGGAVNLYAILSGDSGVMTFRSAAFAGGGGGFLEPMEIPATARWLTLATGAAGDGACDHGTFANAFIGPSPCQPPTLVMVRSVTPAVVSTEGGEALLVSGEGFAPGMTALVGGLPLLDVQVLDSRRLQGICPPLPAGIHDVRLFEQAGAAGGWCPSALRAVGAATQRTSFEESFLATDLIIDEIGMKPDGSMATRVRIRGTEPAGSPGFPALPCLHRQVVIPAGAVIAGATLSAASLQRLPGHPRVEWAQSPQPGQAAGGIPRPPQHGEDPDGRPVWYPAPDVSEPLHPSVLAAGIWPPEPVVVEGTSEVGGYQLVRIAIWPVSWSPLDGTLTRADEFTVTVFHDGGTLPAGPAETYQQAAERDFVRDTVVNPQAVTDPPVALRPPEAIEAWYLIITDDRIWNENKTPQGSPFSLGDIAAELQRLADWKTQKGIKAAVVKVTDIVNGRYGNFTAQTRDLQEVIRKFLKHARKNFGTYWVLLAGDARVIPARRAVHYIGDAYIMPVQGSSKPDAYKAYADPGGFFRIRSPELGNINWYDGRILDPDTGIHYRYDPNASPQMSGWYFVKDDSYTPQVVTRTDFIRLYGPSTVSPPSVLYQATPANTIPTDLYYASVASSLYDQPGVHDWDGNGNGLYGEFILGEDQDGVDFWPDLKVGRVPLYSDSQARTWVDKVLAYEKYEGLPADFGRRMLLSSANWWPPPVLKPGNKNPPEKNTYYSGNGSTEARLRFDGTPGGIASQWKLIAWNSESDFWEVPYDTAPSGTKLGYYWATDESYSTVSQVLGIPILNAFIEVKGPANRIHPAGYFLDDIYLDGSGQEKEVVKALFDQDYPAVDIRKRYYEDYDEVPGYPEADLFLLTGDVLKSPLSDGYNLISSSGHGWWSGCCGFSGGMFQNDVTNGLRGGILYADSCLTGRFTETGSTPQLYLTSSKGGGVAYIGSSVYSWIGTGHIFEMAFWRRLGLFRHLAWLQDSKSFITGNKFEKWVNFASNLMGDPEMTPWIGTPERLDVDYEPCIQTTDPITVTVRRNAQPVKGAIVCLTGDQGLFLWKATPSTGVVTFPAPPWTRDANIVMTVTLLGRIPYQGGIGVDTALCGSSEYYPGDGNGDGTLDVSDPIVILDFLFQGGVGPPCTAAGDANGDGVVDISDPVRLLLYLFQGAPAPPGYTPGEPLACPTGP